jgi:hypothetical protein
MSKPMKFTQAAWEAAKEPNPDPPCEGQYYRCTHSKYVDSRGRITMRVELSPLRRMSCKRKSRCSHCEYIELMISESDIDDLIGVELQHGKIYYAGIESSTSYEGEYDDWLAWTEHVAEEKKDG